MTTDGGRVYRYPFGSTAIPFGFVTVTSTNPVPVIEGGMFPMIVVTLTTFSLSRA